MERLNRREFIKIGSLTGTLGFIAGIDTAFGRRIGQERHPLNPELNYTLSFQAETIVPYINFKNFERAKELGASGYNIIPKPKGFASMLVTMAYYEGGQDGVSKTLKAISEKGLEIVLDKPRPGTIAHVANPLLEPGRPYTITIDPAYLFSGIFPVTHEMYHIHQYIRDGMGKSFLINLLVSPAWLSIYNLVSYVVDKEKYLSRKRFLSGAIKLGYSGLLLISASPILFPNENQAYTQTDKSIPDALVADPYFQFDSADLFDFQK